MNRVWFLLAGLAGGVLGGMGMGGGTLLIPILTFLLGVPYRLAAWINLVAFLPTAIVALIIHCKNNMVDRRASAFLLLFASIGLLVGAFVVGKVPEEVLRRIFGIFLIVVGSLSIICVFVGYFKRKRDKNDILNK